MFKRLFVLLLLAVATLSTSLPARASTPTVDMVFCPNTGGGYYHCYAYVTGGTASYTSFFWVVTATGFRRYSYTTSYPELLGRCVVGNIYTVELTVTDSAGDTAVGSTSFRCESGAD